MIKKMDALMFSLICAASLLWVQPIFAGETKDIVRSITVQGQGKIQAVPDIAVLSVEVSQEGSALDAVSAHVREQMQKALTALKRQGIEEKDIQTQVYQVQPRYEYDKAGNAKRKGYSVTNRITAKVHDLNKVGSVLSTVVESGATAVNGPDFDFDHPQALERQALAKAMEDAKAKAMVLAQAANASVGEVTTITQNGSGNWPGQPRPMRMAGAMTSLASAAEPISVGEQSFTATVTATFALK